MVISWVFYIWFTHTDPSQLDLRFNVLTNLWPTEINYFFFPSPSPTLQQNQGGEERSLCSDFRLLQKKTKLSPPIFEGSLGWTVLPVDPVPNSLHSFAHFLTIPARKRASDLDLRVVISRPVSYS